MRALVFTLTAVVLVFAARKVELERRVERVWAEFTLHWLPFYALAFLVAPNEELAPGFHVRALPGGAAAAPCAAGCLLFNVWSDASAVDATLELDDGRTFTPKVDGRQLKFRPELERPIDAWLTWKPQVSDPGVGSGEVLCGQALSEVSVRPARRPNGRVALRLRLEPTPDHIASRFLGASPYVP